ILVELLIADVYVADGHLTRQDALDAGSVQVGNAGIADLDVEGAIVFGASGDIDFVHDGAQRHTGTHPGVVQRALHLAIDRAGILEGDVDGIGCTIFVVGVRRTDDIGVGGADVVDLDLADAEVRILAGWLADAGRLLQVVIVGVGGSRVGGGRCRKRGCDQKGAGGSQGRGLHSVGTTVDGGSGGGPDGNRTRICQSKAHEVWGPYGPEFHLTSWMRSSLGRAKTMFSGSPSRSCTLPSAPSSRRRAITSCTSTSGAEAPAVTPIRRLPASHSGRMSAAPSIRCACTPSRSASSRRRLELELLAEPTTSTRSALPASSLTASWRFWVA